MIDWTALETWNVGDKLDAETWDRRWRNPMSLMLRRPLTIIRRTTDLSVPAASGWGAVDISFDTIDIDDDGMAVTGTPVTRLYVQRNGVHDLYVAAPYISNGAASDILGVGLKINGVSLDDFLRQAPLVGASGTDLARGAVFTATLTEGTEIIVTTRNETASAVTIKAQYNAPRLAVLWRGPGT